MRYKIAPGIIFKSSGDKLVAVNEQDEDEFCIYEFKESAAILCKHLRLGASHDELKALLLSEYQVSEKEAADDIDEFLATLINSKIIVKES